MPGTREAGEGDEDLPGSRRTRTRHDGWRFDGDSSDPLVSRRCSQLLPFFALRSSFLKTPPHPFFSVCSTFPFSEWIARSKKLCPSCQSTKEESFFFFVIFSLTSLFPSTVPSQRAFHEEKQMAFPSFDSWGYKSFFFNFLSCPFSLGLPLF